jgi:hypothetical protein
MPRATADVTRWCHARGAVRNYPSADSAAVDPRRYGSAGRGAVAPEVARLLSVIGAVGAGVVGGGAGEPLSPVE